MKDTNIKWIGAIPDNWHLNKIGQLFNLRNKKVSDKEYAPLSVSRGGIVPQMESVAKSDASDDRKLVLKGDFAINSRSDRKQSCGVSSLDGSVSLINHILYAKDNNVIYNDYLNFLLKNYGFAEEFYRWGHGIVADLWTTRWQEMKSIMLPLPPFEVQKKIYDFLTVKLSEIDDLIEVENKQIEKLKEYKQAVITEAVTKGLDPTAPMKDSGVKWIGEIPQDWKVFPLKYLFSFGKGLPITKENLIEEGIPVVSYGQIHAKWNTGVTLHNELKRFVSDTYLETNPECLVNKGDFIFADTSEDREGCGNAAFVDSQEVLFAGYHTIVLRANDKAYSKYLAYLFLTDNWRHQIRTRVSGVKLFSISKRILCDTSVLLPNNSEAIIDFLDDKCANIECLIEIKHRKIDELNEYKKSLIYECVTGKKEVI